LMPLRPRVSGANRDKLNALLPNAYQSLPALVFNKTYYR
jgi:hypothetical protein